MLEGPVQVKHTFFSEHLISSFECALQFSLILYIISYFLAPKISPTVHKNRSKHGPTSLSKGTNMLSQIGLIHASFLTSLRTETCHGIDKYT
jgi:hypothetical protein